MAQSGTKGKNIQKAAKLVAEDVLSDEQIAKDTGIPRRTLARLKKKPDFIKVVEKIKGAKIEGAEQAAQSKGFDTVARLIELANTPIEKTNGNMAGQVRACMGVAAIRGEVVQLHGDVTERLKNKSVEELDFIAVNRRDPKDQEELMLFTEARKRELIQ